MADNDVLTAVEKELQNRIAALKEEIARRKRAVARITSGGPEPDLLTAMVTLEYIVAAVQAAHKAN